MYHWKPETGSFSVGELDAVDLLHRFEDQSGAEEWLGLFYGELLEQGVAEVSLYEEDRLIYGPMSLAP